MTSSKLEICPIYSSNPAKCTGEPNCCKLHICKFYLLYNSCRNSEAGTTCKYGHDLTTPHNKSLLRDKKLGDSSLEELRCLMQSPKGTRKPSKLILCKFYNTTKGCSKDGTGKPCPFVHLCTHYVNGTCKYGNGCKRSHNILDPKTKELLEKNGLNTKRSSDEVLQNLRERTASKTEDGDSGDTKHTLTHSASAQSIRSNSNQPTRDTEPDETSTEICIHHLKGKCRFETSCRKQHKNSMYQWQFRQQGERWTDFVYSDNLELEKKYTDAQNGETTIYFNKKELLTVQFDLMVGDMRNGTSLDIRRLSTESSAVHKFQPLATWWRWFYRDQDDKLIIHGAAKTTGDKSKNESNILEQCYQDNPTGQKVLSSSDHEIIIDFIKMLQIDPVQETKSIIRRRPAFVHPKEVEKRKKVSGSFRRTDTSVITTSPINATDDTPTKPKTLPENGLLSDIPPHWTFDRQKTPDEFMDHIQMIVCPSSNQEYDEVRKLFFVTMPTSASIVQIKRIENGELWMNFSNKRMRMKKKTKIGDVNELQLFHGTNEKFVEAICNQGFDFRFCGSKSGTAYGKGSYFAKRSSYSDSYTDYGGKKYMFVVRVLAGDYTKGNTSYVRPHQRVHLTSLTCMIHALIIRKILTYILYLQMTKFIQNI